MGACLPFACLPIGRRKGRKPRVAFYSQVYGGNAKPVFEKLRSNPDLECFWVAPSKTLCKKLLDKGVPCYYMNDFMKAFELVGVDVWVSTQGLCFPGFKKAKALFGKDERIIDLWHGVGGDNLESRMGYLRSCDVICTNSEHYKNEYIRIGIDGKKVKVTGYARLDLLVNDRTGKAQLSERQGVPPGRRNILYAPTWGYDDIGISDFRGIEKMCERLDCNFIIRPHFNYGESVMRGIETRISGLKRVFLRPASNHPCAEDALLLADVLVTDWSSIAFDYMLLKRPIIYVDREAPHAGTYPNANERVGGYHVKDDNGLIKAVEAALSSPELFEGERKPLMERFYGDTADGKATERCVKEIIKLVSGKNGE